MEGGSWHTARSIKYPKNSEDRVLKVRTITIVNLYILLLSLDSFLEQSIVGYRCAAQQTFVTNFGVRLFEREKKNYPN